MLFDGNSKLLGHGISVLFFQDRKYFDCINLFGVDRLLSDTQTCCLSIPREHFVSHSTGFMACQTHPSDICDHIRTQYSPVGTVGGSISF